MDDNDTLSRTQSEPDRSVGAPSDFLDGLLTPAEAAHALRKTTKTLWRCIGRSVGRRKLALATLSITVRTAWPSGFVSRRKGPRLNPAAERLSVEERGVLMLFLRVPCATFRIHQ